jgi:hypothetical protein
MIMDWKMNFSWLFLAGGALWGADTAQQGSNPVLAALCSGYILWALYWGMPAMWRWWRRLSLPGSDRVKSLLGLAGLLSGGLFAVGFWLARKIFSFTLLIVGGYFFSVCGGGPYQFVKHWRTAHST